MKRNCIILGSGRSGTSLAAGILAKAGYFMGYSIWPANEGNPKGQFEDEEINGINEALLAQVVPQPSDSVLRGLQGPLRPLGNLQRWLAALPVTVSIPCPPRLAGRIEAATARAPFCFKDPRFCYTLANWRPFLKDALLLCVFRHPSVTASSIVKECERAEYLRDVQMDAQRALNVWESMYRHVLEIDYPAGGDWLFVHYDQLLEGTAFPALETRLGIQVDREFADRALKRSKAFAEVPSHILAIYERLCSLASYDSAARSVRAESGRLALDSMLSAKTRRTIPQGGVSTKRATDSRRPT